MVDEAGMIEQGRMERVGKSHTVDRDRLRDNRTKFHDGGRAKRYRGSISSFAWGSGYRHVVVSYTATSLGVIVGPARDQNRIIFHFTIASHCNLHSVFPYAVVSVQKLRSSLSAQLSADVTQSIY